MERQQVLAQIKTFRGTRLFGFATIVGSLDISGLQIKFEGHMGEAEHLEEEDYAFFEIKPTYNPLTSDNYQYYCDSVIKAYPSEGVLVRTEDGLKVRTKRGDHLGVTEDDFFAEGLPVEYYEWNGWAEACSIHAVGEVYSVSTAKNGAFARLNWDGRSWYLHLGDKNPFVRDKSAIHFTPINYNGNLQAKKDSASLWEVGTIFPDKIQFKDLYLRFQPHPSATPGKLALVQIRTRPGSYPDTSIRQYFPLFDGTIAGNSTVKLKDTNTTHVYTEEALIEQNLGYHPGDNVVVALNPFTNEAYYVFLNQRCAGELEITPRDTTLKFTDPNGRTTRLARALVSNLPSNFTGRATVTVWFSPNFADLSLKRQCQVEEIIKAPMRTSGSSAAIGAPPGFTAPAVTTPSPAAASPAKPPSPKPAPAKQQAQPEPTTAAATATAAAPKTQEPPAQPQPASLPARPVITPGPNDMYYPDKTQPMLIVHMDHPLGVSIQSRRVFKGTLFMGAGARRTGQLVAVKQFQPGEDVREVNNFKDLSEDPSSSVFLVKFIQSFTVGNTTYLVLEYCDYTLDSYLNARADDLDGPARLQLAKQLLDALDFLHKTTKFVHRDLKPSNILIANNKIKLADFGLSRHQNSLANASVVAASGLYAAPEMGSSNTEKGDVWSLGCLFSLILWNTHPFDEDNNATTARNINNNYPVALETFTSLKDACAVDLIRSMIQHEPENRISLSEVVKHPLFWKSSQIIKFLEECKEYMFKRDEKLVTNINTQIDKRYISTEFRRRGWFDALPPDFLKHLQDSHRAKTNFEYKHQYLADLMSCFRNWTTHYQQASPALREKYAKDDDPTKIFMDTFPTLILYVWKECQKRAEELQDLLGRYDKLLAASDK